MAIAYVVAMWDDMSPSTPNMKVFKGATLLGVQSQINQYKSDNGIPYAQIIAGPFDEALS